MRNLTTAFPVARIFRFGLTGLFVTGVHVVIALLFLNFVSPTPTVANGVAFVFATVISYLINTLWTFSRPLHNKTLLRFLTVSGSGCALTILIAGLAEAHGLSHGYGIALVVATVPLFTFLLHSFWTYR